MKTNRWMILSTSAFLTLITGDAAAQVFDFKGIVLGSKVSDKTLTDEHQLRCKRWDREYRWCTGKTTLLGMTADEKVVIDEQNVVTSILITYQTTTVWPKDIAAELSMKFGPPKNQRQSMMFRWVNSKGEEVFLEHTKLTMKTAIKIKKELPPNINKKDL